MAKNTKLDLFFREAVIETGEREAGIVRLSFASELPVLRQDGEGNKFWEVLSHAPGDANLSLLNRSGMVLQDHDEKMEIGDVVRGSAKVHADKKTRADIKLFDNPWMTRAKETPANIPISVGYIPLTELRTIALDADGIPTRVYSWRPYEISLLTKEPADDTVGIGRSKPVIVDSPETVEVGELVKKLSPEEKKRMKILLNSDGGNGGGTTLTVADVTKARGEGEAAAQTAERSRVKQISTVADELTKKRKDMGDKIRGMASAAIESGETIGDFQVRAMNEVISAKPLRGELSAEEMGVSERQAGEYSIMRGIQSVINRASRGNNVPDGFEGEMHQEMIRREKDAGGVVKYDGFVIPPWAKVRMDTSGRRMSRDLTAGVFGQGGATVATQLQVPIIEILRNKLVTSAWGVRTLSGLSGNVVIPRQTGAATAYSVAETAALTLSTQVLDQIALSPKRLGITNNYSKQLLIQSSIDVENFVRDDAMKVLALDMDRLILNGSGAGSEMLGIMQTVGIGSVTFGAAATFAKLVSFETLVAAQNVILDKGTTAYLTTPTAKGTLKSAAKLLTGATTVAAEALWQNDEINGYRADASNQIPGNLMLFGDASQFIVGFWGGVDCVVDIYTLAKNGEVAITWNAFMDGTCRHPQAFCLSTDSTAQ